MPDHDDAPSTKLVIPYYPADPGARPLPSGVVSWLCPGIRVNGTPALGVYAPGVPMQVSVDVTNHGAGTGAAPVYVTVWWTDPTAGFVLTQSNVFGQTTLAVPSHATTVTSPPMVGTIPVGAPAHVCLIARAVSPADTLPKGAIADPVGDRHWAQLNLNAVPAAKGAFEFAFWAANPGAEPATFELLLRPVRGEALETLARHLGHRAVAVDGARLHLRVDEVGSGPVAVVDLRPGQRRRLALDGTLPAPLSRRSCTAVEVLQVQRGTDRLTGSLGLILYGDA